MTLGEIEKKAEKYARKTMKVDWEGFPIDKEARKEAYIAGATEICSCCSMGFKRYDERDTHRGGQVSRGYEQINVEFFIEDVFNGRKAILNFF